MLGLDFDVIDRPRRWQRGARTAIPRRAGQQPQPQDIWGCDLPQRVPEPLLPSCSRLLAFACECWWTGNLGRLRANARLAEWLAFYVEQCSDHEDQVEDPWLHRCLGIARAGLAHGMTATGLAAALGISRWTLASQLAQHGYPGPRDLFLSLRMERARAMLAHPDYTHIEIATVCGYRSQAAFSRQFGRYHACSPTAWRRERHSG